MSRHKNIFDDDENNNKVLLISQTKPHGMHTNKNETEIDLLTF